MGGQLLATVVTKGVVPLLYVVSVKTLHVIEWKPDAHDADAPSGPEEVTRHAT
ncbi:MAG: hypothetical protein HYV09_24495 [Deltaproteobacteria bacterium]|nr:hypothetical protein [Deltaproteobacteria bacterium]